MTAALPLWFAACAFALALWQWLDLWLLRWQADWWAIDIVVAPFEPRGDEHAE